MVKRRSAIHTQEGFTLIEAVMVIVITGIIASMVAIFIKTAVDSYFDSVRRAALTDAADIALRRLSREVRLAVPNSLRVSLAGGVYSITLIPTRDGGRYRNESDGSSGGQPLCSGGTVNASFDVLGPMPAVAVGDSVVVFNDASLNPGPGCAAPSDVYCGGSRAAVTAVGAHSLTIGALANSAVICSYENNRFQVVDQNIRAVTYTCPAATAGAMQRFANYGFSTTPGGTSATVVNGATCFVDDSNAHRPNGSLYVNLTLTDNSGERVEVFRQIHVDNTP